MEGAGKKGDGQREGRGKEGGRGGRGRGEGRGEGGEENLLCLWHPVSEVTCPHSHHVPATGHTDQPCYSEGVGYVRIGFLAPAWGE